MNNLTRLRAALRARSPVFGFTSLIHDAAVLPQYRQPHVDFVLYDLEHGDADAATLAPYWRLCRAHDIPTVVRVEDALPHLVAKPIDLGCDGILLPRVEYKTQVKTALDAMRLPPAGKKGYGGRFQLREGESVDEYQQNRLLLIQIESPLGVENLPGILEEYAGELSCVVIGPYDLSFLCGTPLDIYSDAVTRQIEAVVELCDRHRVSAGCYCQTLEDARKRRAMGMNLIWMASDATHLVRGIAEAADFVHGLA